MKPSVTKSLAAAVALTLSVASLARAATSDVYQATASWSAVGQTDNNNVPAIEKIKITNTEIVNLARGRQPVASGPTSEVLALVVDREDLGFRLIVFDTTLKENLATICDFDDGSGAADTKKGELAILGDVNNVGNPTDRFRNGWIALFGKVNVVPVVVDGVTNSVPDSVKGSVAGRLDLTVTFLDDTGNTNVTEDVTLAITKGKLSTDAKLGILEE